MVAYSTTLRFRLMLLVVIAILPIFGLMLYQASLERDRKLRECRDNAGRLASLAAGSISQVAEGARQMLMALACTEPVRAMDGPEASKIFANLLQHSRAYLNLGLVRSDGLVIASGVPMRDEVYLTDRRWFCQLQETRDFSVSDYLVGRISGKPSINIGFPLQVTPGEPLSGAVYASLDLNALQGCIAHVRLPQDAVILVVDRRGTYLARHPQPERAGTSSRSWVTLWQNGGRPELPVSATGVDGITRDYCYATVSGFDGVLVAVGISRAAATAESRAEFWRYLSLLIFWTAASLAAAGLVGHVSVLKHVSHLTETARKLAGGDWSASSGVSGGASEIQQLARTFEAMAAALRAHNEELEAQVRRRTAELTAVNASLKEALVQVKTLNGLLPICSGCKKIRDDRGYWNQIELYITDHSDAQFSHSLCPECAKKYFPELDFEAQPEEEEK